MKSSGLKNFNLRIGIVALVCVVAPMFLANLFSLSLLLENKGSEVLCTLTENDYLLYLAVQAERTNIAIYMPFAMWHKLGVIVMQAVLFVILVYEIYISIINRKVKVKESLFKNHKRSMLLFFTVLLSLFVMSDWYISNKNVDSIQDKAFVYSLVEDRKDFFLICSKASTVEIGEKSSITMRE